MMKNSGATTRPWLTIWSTAPWAPTWVSEKIPSVMKPSCAIDEYATTSVAEVCVNAITDPYRMLSTRDHQQQLLVVTDACGNSGRHDPQEAVGADLRQHARKHRDHGRGRRAVGVRHPAVQREGRHLHQERGGEEQEDPVLRALSESGAARSSESTNVVCPPSGVARMPVAAAAASISRLPTSV